MNNLIGKKKKKKHLHRTDLGEIFQLVSGFGKDPVITRYLRSINIYIFPCLNPDGYEYTRSKPNPQVLYSIFLILLTEISINCYLIMK